MQEERLLETRGRRGLVQMGEGLKLNNNEGWHVSTLAGYQHCPTCFISITTGEGSCGHGREREQRIKMGRGAGDKTGEGSQSCLAGRARTQGFTQLRPLVSL